MDRHGIMDPSLNSATAQIVPKLIAHNCLHNKKVINVQRSRQSCLEAQPFDSVQKRIIALRMRSSPLVPFSEVRELHAQNGCLKCIEASVRTFVNVLIFFNLSIVPKPSNSRGEFFVIRGNQTAVSSSSEVLCRIKAER